MTTMNGPVKEQSTTRRKFDRTFKQEALVLWAKSGKSAAVIAQELGILPNRLYFWKKVFEAKEREPVSPKLSAEQLAAEVMALRRENEHLRQQRDILKKTLGILSELPSSGIKG